MKSWTIGGTAIALLVCTPALGQPFQNRRSEPIYQPQYQSQYPHRYSPQAPVIYVTPGSTAIIIYPNSPYSNRPRYGTTPYQRSVPIYPANSSNYSTFTRSNSAVGTFAPFELRSSPTYPIQQTYPVQRIYPEPYPYGGQVYPIYGAPYRRY